MVCINIRMNQDIFAAKEKFIEDLEEQFHNKEKNFTSDASKISYVDTASYRLTYMYLFFHRLEDLNEARLFAAKEKLDDLEELLHKKVKNFTSYAK